jgi:tetratricopeptide (TPR) repeat protein
VLNEELGAIQGLIGKQDWSAAMPRLAALLETQPAFAYAWYLLGQCQRFSGDLAASIFSLSKAVRLDPSQESYYLALGIAYQLVENFEESLGAFRRAHAIKPNYVEAYNSAALTLKRMGNLEKSAEIYDAALDALTLECINKQPNAHNGRIYGFRQMHGGLWMSFLSKAMLFLCAQDDIWSLRWPTGKAAALEYETHENGGLLWKDVKLEGDETSRVLMPNLFDCVRENFISDRRYSLILGNKSLVLASLGRSDEAEKHESEAIEFQSLLN